MFWKSINRDPGARQSAGSQDELEDDPLKPDDSLEEVPGSSDEPAEGDKPSPDEEEKPEDQEESDFLPEGIEVPEELKPLFDDVNNRMKSAFNKKLTELDKGKGKISADSYEALLENPEFMTWAETQLKTQGYTPPAQEKFEGDITKLSMEEALQSWDKLGVNQQKVYWNGLDKSGQFMFSLGVQQKNSSQQQATERQNTVDAQMVEKYGDKYTSKKKEISRMQGEVAKSPYIYPDEAFKILDYLDNGKREYERGLLEGKKGVKQKKDDGSIRPKGGSGTKSKLRKKPKSFREAFGQAEEEVGSAT